MLLSLFLHTFQIFKNKKFSKLANKERFVFFPRICKIFKTRNQVRLGNKIFFKVLHHLILKAENLSLMTGLHWYYFAALFISCPWALTPMGHKVSICTVKMIGSTVQVYNEVWI